MILWGIVCGALIGWCSDRFDLFGAFAGALVGWPMAYTLRRAVRSEIATLVESAAPAYAPTAAAVPMPARPPLAARLAEADSSAVRRRSELQASESVAPDSDAVRRDTGPAVPDPLPEPETDDRDNIVGAALATARAWLFGGNTIVRAGLVILFIGLAFLARYAAQHSRFPIELRLSLIMLAGMALLGVGFWRRHVRPAFALALQGTGVAAIYLAIFAATRLFDVVPTLPAFGLMIVVCALASALALLQNSQSLAVAAFLGGFAVPVLLSTGSGSSVVLFSYYTVLNLAVLFIAERRAWRMVNLVGFFATFGVATVWGVLRYEPSQYAVAQPFLIAFVLIYIVAALLYARNAKGKIGNVVDSTLLFGPALAGFGLQVGLVRHLALGSAFSALGFGAVYLALALFVRRRGYEQNALLRESLIAIGVGFATVAIPLALGARWTSSAWALEGTAAFWVGMRQARWLPRLFGLLLQVVAALMFMSTLHGNPEALPLFNATFLAALLIALPVLALAWWLRAAPLPTSGTRLANAYAAVEATFGAPMFLAGFGLWWLAWALEAVRNMPGAETGMPLVHAFPERIQPLLVMLAFVVSAAIAAWGGRRLNWRVATWPANATLLPIAVVLLSQVLDEEHVLYTPDWLIWVAAIVVHYALLRAADRDPAGNPQWQRVVHVGSAWVMTLWLADCLWLGIDRAGLWMTSWASAVMLFSMTLALAALTAAATRGHGRWPLDRHATAYYWVAAAPLAVLMSFGFMVAALLDPGRAAPLPYVPLLNPLELTLGFGLGTLALWRRTIVATAPPGSAWMGGPGALAVLAFLAFVVVNTMWLRIAHHFLGVAWTPDAMLDSFVVQTGLAILWTVLALGLMIVAHRRLERSLWLVGAGLLAAVVAKLLLVDLANAGGGERVVTFIAVGVLMLVTGYFAPLPPAHPDAVAGTPA